MSAKLKQAENMLRSTAPVPEKEQRGEEMKLDFKSKEERERYIEWVRHAFAFEDEVKPAFGL